MYIDESKEGLILEVDLEYPKELHDNHNDYPLVPEQICIKKEVLSDYCRNIQNKFNLPTGEVLKLIPTLKNKTNCVLHCRNLHL